MKILIIIAGLLLVGGSQAMTLETDKEYQLDLAGAGITTSDWHYLKSELNRRERIPDRPVIRFKNFSGNTAEILQMKLLALESPMLGGKSNRLTALINKVKRANIVSGKRIIRTGKQTVGKYNKMYEPREQHNRKPKTR